MTFAAYLASGLIGLIFHWYIRYSQGRTNSTFFEYLMVYKSRTIASFMSIFASAAGIFAGSPPDLTMQTLLLAFSAGYMLDSMANKDVPVSVPVIVVDKEATTIKAQVKKDEDKSLTDIIDESNSL